MPGVSRNAIWPSGRVTMPRTTWRVVCGLSVTIETFSPTTRFTNVDFPEFGRPMIETNPDLLMSLGSERLQSQSLYSPPVGCEYFDFNSSMFNLLSWGREF